MMTPEKLEKWVLMVEQRLAAIEAAQRRHDNQSHSGGDTPSEKE